jgi:hypothetical protein
MSRHKPFLQQASIDARYPLHFSHICRRIQRPQRRKRWRQPLVLLSLWTLVLVGAGAVLMQLLEETSVLVARRAAPLRGSMPAVAEASPFMRASMQQESGPKTLMLKPSELNALPSTSRAARQVPAHAMHDGEQVHGVPE